MKWQPERKRPRGKLKKKKHKLDSIKQDLEGLEIRNWEELVQDSRSYKVLIVAAKTYK